MDEDYLPPSLDIPRLMWIDAAKGLSILLVVFGHVFDAPVGNSFALVRMPFFFFLSGYVFKQRAFGDFLWKRVNSLLVPYVAYMIVLTFIWFAVTARSGLSQVELSLRVRDILTDLWRGGEYLPGYCATLWFLGVLFFALLAYNHILAVFGSPASTGAVACMLVAIVVAYAMQPYHSYLGLGIVPMALAFVWAGSMYRLTTVPRWLIAPAIVVTAVAYQLTPVFDFRSADWGIPILTIAGALSACYLAAMACERLSTQAWFRLPLTAIGPGSIVVMALHASIAFKLRTVPGLPPIFNLLVSLMVPVLIFWQLKNANWIIRWFFLGHVPQRRHVTQDIHIVL